MADLTILDIGHGNCAVLHDAAGAVVIDAGTGDTLLEFLEDRGIATIDAVLISHADSDHVAGLLTLLTQQTLSVGTIYMNGDAVRRSQLWQALRVAIADARGRGLAKLRTELTTAISPVYDSGDARIEVLAPTPEVALGGIGGQDLQGRPLTANSMSAVLRVVGAGDATALLPGDIDGTGLENLLSEHQGPRARVLVFPHHGGRPGDADPGDFATRLCQAVQPQVVVFSIGRGRHGTPLAEIVQGVRRASSDVHIACTQLSENCALTLPREPAGHLGTRPARGRQTGRCCAGTVRVPLSAEVEAMQPMLTEHRAFVQRWAPRSLCLAAHGVVKGPAQS